MRAYSLDFQQHDRNDHRRSGKRDFLEFGLSEELGVNKTESIGGVGMRPYEVFTFIKVFILQTHDFSP